MMGMRLENLLLNNKKLTRFPLMKKPLIYLFLLLVTPALGARPVLAGSYAEDKKQVEAYADELIRLRVRDSEILAKSGKEIDEKTFGTVYGRLYKRIDELRKNKGLIVTYSAIKYRNPQNSGTPFEIRLMAQFRSDRNFKKFWTVTMMGNRSYSRLLRPVFARKSCLTCHGPKDKRAAFIARRYSTDKSYGFKDGELMGLISIYMPDEED